MHLNLKSHSVNLSGLTIEMVLALHHAMCVWRAHGVSQLTVTSANDGKHKDGSKHYSGNAIDLRSRTLPDDLGMAAELASRLGPDYDVVVELDHLHVEFDPKP